MGNPNRKTNRKRYHDYSESGAYFITVCTKNRECILSRITVGALTGRPQTELTEIGNLIEEAIKRIPQVYYNTKVCEYVIMPDHVHMVLEILPDVGGRPMSAPTVGRITNQLKGYVTKCLGYSIWQKSFYDHVIRNADDYRETVKYIRDNPSTWYFK